MAVKQISGPPVTFDNVKPGKHPLTVQLVGADHRPIQPEVKQIVHFTTTNKPATEAASKVAPLNSLAAASKGSDHTAHHTSAPDPGQLTQPAQSQSQATSYQVDIQNYAFIPESLSIPTGSAVTFTNHGDVDHTVTAKRRLL